MWTRETRRAWYEKNKNDLNARRRQTYVENSDYRADKISRAMRYRERNQTIVREYKLGRGCQRCGYRAHHVALELHHRDKTQKEFKIGCTTCSVERLMSEIQKCEVLCSNCHKIHHFEEGWMK